MQKTMKTQPLDSRKAAFETFVRIHADSIGYNWMIQTIKKIEKENELLFPKTYEHPNHRNQMSKV